MLILKLNLMISLLRMKLKLKLFSYSLLLLTSLSIIFNVIIKLIFKYKILKRELIFYFTEFVIIIKNIKFTITARLIKKQIINVYKHLNDI